MENTLVTAQELAINLEVHLLRKPKEALLPISSLPKLNQRIWGLGKGRVIIVAGRTAMGKTALMSQISCDLAKANNRVVYLSLEMPKEELHTRCFSREFKISNNELERGNFDKYVDQYKHFVNSMQSFPLKYSDCIGMSWKQIDAMINACEINKPQAIVIDHINHIKTSGINDKAVIDDYLTNILTLSRKHNITFIIGAQINRISQNEKNTYPELHHLKGTGRLEEIADMVLLLYWPYYYDNRKPLDGYQIIIGKNRYGSTGIHECRFKPQYSLFEEVIADEG